METATNEQPTPTPEAIKQQLEIDKLNAEIRELNKSWYKKPVYLAAMLPAFVAIVSVIILYLNGNFEVKNKELQVRKEALDLDIRKFELKKDSLAKEIKRSEDSLQTYKAEISILLTKYDTQSKELYSAKDTIQKFKVNNDSIIKAVAKLKLQFTQQGNKEQAQKNIRDLENIIKTYNRKLNILEEKININENVQYNYKEIIDKLNKQLLSEQDKVIKQEKELAELDSLLMRKKH